MLGAELRVSDVVKYTRNLRSILMTKTISSKEASQKFEELLDGLVVGGLGIFASVLDRKGHVGPAASARRRGCAPR